ncbi:MAG: hypothetical protein ACTSQY_00140 [Candidatus Odinarchaeia archaeon]
MNKLTREEKNTNLEAFYVEMNLDKNKILEANKYLDPETNELKMDSYSCICCFCKNIGSEICDRSCCKTGEKCVNFSPMEDEINEFKK